VSQPRPWTTRVIHAALFVACLAAVPALAAELHVAPDGSGDYPTIQAAIDAAVAGDEVVLADGTFTGEGNVPILLRHRGIVIRSASGDPSRTIVDAEGSGDLLNDHLSEDVEPDVVRGITLTGVNDEDGRAIAVSYPTRIESCWITGNRARVTIDFHAGPHVLRQSLVVGNLSSRGVVYGDFVQYRVEDSIIAANRTTDATGLPSAIESGEAAHVVVERTVVWGNCSAHPDAPQIGVWPPNPGALLLSCSVVAPGSVDDEVDLGEGVVEADPLFCAPDECDAAPLGVPGDYHVAANSPCLAAQHPCGVDVGNVEVGCDAVPIAPMSWTTLKDRFQPVSGSD